MESRLRAYGKRGCVGYPYPRLAAILFLESSKGIRSSGHTRRKFKKHLSSRYVEPIRMLFLFGLAMACFQIQLRRFENMGKRSSSVMCMMTHLRIGSMISPPRFHRWLWRAFINALPHYDLALFSKQQNVDDAYRFGCKKAAVLPQYFVPEIHYPRVLTDEEDYFRCDVAFAGHFEPDGRDRHIRQLVDSGLKVNVYGDFTWKGTPTKGWPENFTHLPRADGDVYPRALSGASMCLCFMSKMNRDQYTTRCFEIPACGSVLVCERTVPLTQLFKEDEEAIFFATSEELVRKALYLKENTAVRCEIAHAGLKKVHSAGHSVEGRAGDFLSLVNLLLRG